MDRNKAFLYHYVNSADVEYHDDRVTVTQVIKVTGQNGPYTITIRMTGATLEEACSKCDEKVGEITADTAAADAYAKALAAQQAKGETS